MRIVVNAILTAEARWQGGLEPREFGRGLARLRAIALAGEIAG